MSDILEAIKDAVSPKRRQSATTETYDPETRGPYANRPSAGDGQPEVAPPAENQNPGRVGQSNLSNTATRETGKAANPTSPQKQHTDADNHGGAGHSLSDYGGAAAKPVHKEGGKYGLS